MAPRLDAVIIAAGDGDFVPLVEYLQMSHGCQVEVISFGRSSSGSLIETTDDFINMDDDPKKYLIGYRTRRRKKSTKKTNNSKKNSSK